VVQNIPSEGFLAASSGNFGQALACAAQMNNRKCIIVMPENSAKVKIKAVQSYDATVDLIDTTIKSRSQRVNELAMEYPSFHVASAYDCDHVIAGNSSLGREIAEAGLGVDMVLAPIGGGGLSSGIVVGLGECEDQVPVWGAEPSLANDAIRSLQAGYLIRNEHEPQTIADGARTVSLGEKNWRILKDGLRGILSVEELYIYEAMRWFAREKLRVEPTGCLTLAALIQHCDHLHGKKIVAVISGGNVDDSVLAKVQ
jgi:threonine dehydratase